MRYSWGRDTFKHMTREQAKRIALSPIKGLAKVESDNMNRERIFAYGRTEYSNKLSDDQWLNIFNACSHLEMFVSNSVPEGQRPKVVADKGRSPFYYCKLVLDREMAARLVNNLQHWVNHGSLNLNDQSDPVYVADGPGRGLYLWRVTYRLANSKPSDTNTFCYVTSKTRSFAAAFKVGEAIKEDVKEPGDQIDLVGVEYLGRISA